MNFKNENPTEKQILQNYISINQTLSENFIEKYQKELSWDLISKYQVLSENFIEKHKNKINFTKLLENKKILKKYIEENKKISLNIKKDNEKKEYVNDFSIF